MRILITGVTETHINHPDRAKSTKFASIPELMRLGFNILGHTVDHRPVRLDEDFAAYDRVFVYLYPLDANAVNAEQVVHVLQKRPNAPVCLDDWSFQRILPSWVPMVSEASLVDRTWIAPLFPWGNHDKLKLPVKQLHAWDPSSLYQSHGMPAVHKLSWQQRKSEWYNASLSADSHLWAQRQRLTWPVHAIGGKALGQPRKLESDIVWDYGFYKGILCPSYAHAGSGWWRVRYLHAQAAGCILGGDEAELATIGTAYSFTLREIEAMSDMQQANLAQQQSQQLSARLATLHDTLSALEDFL